MTEYRRAHRSASRPLLFMAAFASAWLAACGGASATSRSSLETAGNRAADDDRRRAAAPRRSSSAPKLTVTQLAGARVIYSYAGLEPPAALLRQIRAGEVGGVIFFGSNISSLSQIRGVIKTLQAAAKSKPRRTCRCC